jgi:hypothetical protein
MLHLHNGASAMPPCSIRMAGCHEFVNLPNIFADFLSIWSTAAGAPLSFAQKPTTLVWKTGGVRRMAITRERVLEVLDGVSLPGGGSLVGRDLIRALSVEEGPNVPPSAS